MGLGTGLQFSTMDFSTVLTLLSHKVMVYYLQAVQFALIIYMHDVATCKRVERNFVHKVHTCDGQLDSIRQLVYLEHTHTIISIMSFIVHRHTHAHSDKSPLPIYQYYHQTLLSSQTTLYKQLAKLHTTHASLYARGGLPSCTLQRYLLPLRDQF